MEARDKNTKDRKKITTSIDPYLYDKAKIMKIILNNKGENIDGINELLEEGLELLFKKYEDEIDLKAFDKNLNK